MKNHVDNKKAPTAGTVYGSMYKNTKNIIAKNEDKSKDYSAEAYHISRFAFYAYTLIEITDDLNNIREPLMGLIEIADEKAQTLCFELKKNKLTTMGVVGHG